MTSDFPVNFRKVLQGEVEAAVAERVGKIHIEYI